MKFFISLFLTAFFSFALGLFLPWWSIAIAAFVVAVIIPQRGWAAFLSAFLALFILWGGMALYISVANDHILASKMAVLFFKVSNPFVLIFVTALLGALVAGFAALSGFLARRLAVTSKK